MLCLLPLQVGIIDCFVAQQLQCHWRNWWSVVVRMATVRLQAGAVGKARFRGLQDWGWMRWHDETNLRLNLRSLATTVQHETAAASLEVGRFLLLLNKIHKSPVDLASEFPVLLQVLMDRMVAQLLVHQHADLLQKCRHRSMLWGWRHDCFQHKHARNSMEFTMAKLLLRQYVHFIGYENIVKDWRNACLQDKHDHSLQRVKNTLMERSIGKLLLQQYMHFSEHDNMVKDWRNNCLQYKHDRHF